MVFKRVKGKYQLTGTGASLVGYADIRDLDADTTNSMPYAISIAVALDASIIKETSNGPTERYYHEYNRVNDLLAELCENIAEELRKPGHKAIAKRPKVEGNNPDHKTLKTPLPHKTIATRAGLGWIGKSALLITEQYGSAVRLATVLTDAEFEAAKPSNISHCGQWLLRVRSTLQLRAWNERIQKATVFLFQRAQSTPGKYMPGMRMYASLTKRIVTRQSK